MKQFAINVLILILCIAVIAAFILIPENLAKLADAQEEIILAEGHRELDFAAAEAIYANARQVDAVTNGIVMTQAAICIGPAALVVIVVTLFAIVVVRRDEPR
jgi:hypothetical protein